ncbi:MAG: hypothetical protein IJG42_13725 [Muribaculaceae bacterium]|nr:hypothetical protein [Muribaculaceae bacterium]
MKKIFTFVVMAVFAIGTMMANWQPSDTEATHLDKDGSNGQVQMKTMRTDDGKIILTWLRGENTDGVFSYQLHLQVFDADGNAMFGDEGIIVCDKATRTWTTDYGLCLAENGDILLAYTDVRNDPDMQEKAETYFYRYDMQGNPVWDADGILFSFPKLHENAFIVEDVSPVICASGSNIYVAVNHTEYYMEEANEDNWSPSPWFPNQTMPDSVQVNEALWVVMSLDANGAVICETPQCIDSKIMTINPASAGRAFLVYDNAIYGLDAQLVGADMANQWREALTIEERALTTGMYMPTPLIEVDGNGVLMISYRVLTDWYGYQCVNYLNEAGEYSSEAISLTGHIDGDAGIAAMGVKEDRALVAWEWAYSSSEYHINANVVDDEDNYFWTGDNTYGISLDMNDLWGFTPVKVIPVEDGWVILYGNSTSWNGANFMVVKIDDMGNTVWTKQICEDDFKSSGFAVTYDQSNAYIFYTQDSEYDDNWNEIPGSGGMFVMCVDISGKTTAINETQAPAQVVKTEIYTIDGRQVDQMEDGVNIIRSTDANGNVTTTKVLK